MAKLLISVAAAAFVAALAVGGFFLVRNLSTEEAIIRAAGLDPWIEVIASPVFELDSATGRETRKLATGDELKAGATVETRQAGSANLYFPDGSLIRIDSETRFTLETARFDPDEQTLRVRVALAAGRVWSKIIGFATPASVWEVRTANAVATTRGTAFAVEYKNGVSRLIGSEDRVLVQAIDPKTQRLIPDAAVEMSADTFIAIDAELIQKAAAKPTEFSKAVREITPEIREDPWIRRAQEEDRRINDHIREIHAERGSLTEKEVLQAVGEEIRRRFAPDIRKRRDAVKAGESFLRQAQESASENKEAPPPPTDGFLQRTGDRSDTEMKNPAGADMNVLDPQKQPAETIGSTPAQLSPGAPIPQDEPVPQRIIMEPAAPPKEAVEFQPLTFKAILVLSNGERRDVTREAQWRIIGPIGFFKTPGEFIPRLEESVAEFGEGFGTVVAIWKDIKTNKEFIAHSTAIKVVPLIEDIRDPRG